ncbi:MAG: T9SS type A sorting domain-containing protein [Bacteroidales bacterium]|nr:T9SS type A sorting domain-containing protein [Bacteroidales bacterium]
MNRKTSLVLSLGITSLVVCCCLNSCTKKNRVRSDYEKFLVSEYKGLPKGETTKSKESGKEEADRPDQAAFQEYVKTLDPALKAVPGERVLAANRVTDALESLKSGMNELTWMAHPTNMGGRTRTIMFDPNDANKTKIWAGSVTGGLWYNADPNGGEPWTPVNDFWSNLAISCMTYDPNNKQTFYVGTGESQTAMITYRESSGHGTGIMRSTDGGQTWNPMPSTQNWPYVTDILVRNESGVSVIYAGVVSGIYKGATHQATPTNGLYRSIDHGNTWTQVLPNIPGTNYSYAPSDIETNADGSKIFIGTTYGVLNDGSDNDRSGAACILVSADGLSWTVNNSYQQKILAETINKYPGRVMLAKAQSNANIVYAIVASGYVRDDEFIGYGCQFVLKTTDKGATWSELTVPLGVAPLAWHAFAIAVNPINPNVIWLGGMDTYRTTNGGTSWTKQSNWAEMYGNGSVNYVHADIHVIQYKPGSDSELYIGTDGGVFGTRTASAPDKDMKFFEVANNYSTLQYYSCAIHPEAGSIHFIGGLQDNGTMFYKRGKIPTFTDMLSGGDGALCFIDQDKPSIQITTVYHNALYLYSGALGSDPQNVGYKDLGSGTFVNPMDYDWMDNVLFANGANEQLDFLNRLHILTISTNNISGSNTGIALGTKSVVPYSNIKWSETSPVHKPNVYIGTEAGKLFKYADALDTGTLTDMTPETFPTANISSIDIAGSEDTLLVTFSNYGVASVWLTVNGGANWRNVESNLPDMPIRWGIFHPKSGKQVMLATETGIWTTDNILAQNIIWSPDNGGLANVRIDMLKFRKSDNVVLAATHGRGLYTTTWAPSYTNSSSDKPLVADGLKIFPNPTNGRFAAEISLTGQVQFTVMDLSGRLIISESISCGQGTTLKQCDISNEPKGVYLIKVVSGTATRVARVVRE